MTYSIRKTFTLPVTAKRAFALLTSGRSIRAWSKQRGAVEGKIGGRFSMFDGWVNGNVLAYQPGKILAYTWRPNDWKAKTAPSVVVMKFVRVGSKTRITLVHTYLPTKAIRDDHAKGWNDHVVGPLKQYCARKRV